jgi:LacI family transcriptional regulator
MRLRTTRTVACAIRDISIAGFGSFVKAAEEVLRQAGYTLLLTNTDEEPLREIELLRTFAKRRVDGIIMTVSDEADQPLLRALQEMRVPIVLMDRDIALPLDVVAIDHRGGARAATAHLLGLGHRRIGRIAAPFARRAFGDREERWRAALTDAGLDPDAMPHARSEINFDAAAAAAVSLLDAPDPPTAIFCDDDILAGGVYLAVRELDRRIPGDVSVVGFDDLAFTRLLDPPLTTVTADAAGLGARALETLLAHMAGERVAPVQMLPVTLTVRGSTAPPA